MTVERAGEGAGGRRRRPVERGRVRWVVGGGGAGEDAVGRRRQWSGGGSGGSATTAGGAGRGCGGCSAARGTGSGEVG